MGTLSYGASLAQIEVDDRTLAHLEMVIIAKLRRDEKFLFTWNHEVAGGGGRSSIWIHSAIPLCFRYCGSKEPTMNHSWLKELMVVANSPGGLHVVEEPELVLA